MTYESQTVSVRIERPAEEVYRFASDPANLARWAAGLGSDPVPVGDGTWRIETPGGPASVRFAEANDLGVIDHWVTIGELTVYVPLRVIENAGGAEVLFTVLRLPTMSEDDLARDVTAVRADLATLRSILER